jgi:hypothetical protein
VPFGLGAIPIDWDQADAAAPPPDALKEPTSMPASAHCEALPAAALDPKRYVEWSRDFADWIVRAQPLKLFSIPSLKLMSEPGETERDFRIRAQQAGREARDGSVERLRERFAPKFARLTEKIARSRESMEKEEHQVQQQKLQTAVSFGATMLGAFMGRKTVSLSTLGRATTAARGVGRSMKEAQDVALARQRLQEAEAELAAVEADLRDEIAALEHRPDAAAVDVIEIKPPRSGVDVRLVARAWKAID